MTSSARRELEESLRALVPRRSDTAPLLRRGRVQTTEVGLGGFALGYLWGRWRGRRIRRSRARR